MRGELVAEGEDGEADNEDALANVCDCVSHRLNLTERLVRDLVIHMVEESDFNQLVHESPGAHGRACLFDSARERRALEVDGGRDAKN